MLGAGRFTVWILGTSALAWAWLDPRFRDAEGFLDTAFCVPLAVGAALWMIGATLSVRWCRFAPAAWWLALAGVGQAVQLQLIEAGTNVAYQHLRPPNTWLSDMHPLLSAFLVAQVVLVCWGLRRLWSPGCTWLRTNFRLWQLVCVAGIVFLGSATKINLPVSTFVTELVTATALQLLSLVTIVLAGFALPERPSSASGEPSSSSWLDRFLSTPSESAGTPIKTLDRFVLLAALWVVLASYTLSVLSYERHPHIPDEVLYAMHARYLAEGVLALPAPETAGDITTLRLGEATHSPSSMVLIILPIPRISTSTISP